MGRYTSLWYSEGMGKLDVLLEKYPLTFRRGDVRDPFYYGFELDEGWADLVEGIASVSEPVLVSLGDKYVGSFVAQVKSKFGELRFYTNMTLCPEVSDAIRNAECVSRRTCEVCGGQGTGRYVGGYFATLCDTHTP